MSSTIGNKIATDGLVLNLDGQNKRSYPGYGTVWYDTSGYEHNAVIAEEGSFPIYTNGHLDFKCGEEGVLRPTSSDWPVNYAFTDWDSSQFFKNYYVKQAVVSKSIDGDNFGTGSYFQKDQSTFGYNEEWKKGIMGSLVCRRSLSASFEADIILNGQYPGTFIGFTTASSRQADIDSSDADELIEAGFKFDDNDVDRYYQTTGHSDLEDFWTTGEDKKVRVRLELIPTGGTRHTIYDGWSNDTILNTHFDGSNTDEYWRIWIPLYYTGSVWEGDYPPTTPSNNEHGNYLIFNALRVAGTYQAHSLKVPMDLTGKIVDGYTGELWMRPHNFGTSQYHPQHGVYYNDQLDNGVNQPYNSRPSHWLYPNGDGFGMATQTASYYFKWISWVRIPKVGDSSTFGFTIQETGNGYNTGITSTTGGSGTGCTVDITEVDNGDMHVISMAIETVGTGYKVGDILRIIGGDDEHPAEFSIDSLLNWSSARRYYDVVYKDPITNYYVDPFDEPAATNKWWHFVTVWNKSTAKLNVYINGNGFEEFDVGEGYSTTTWEQYPPISFGSGTLLDISHLNWEADGLLDVVRLYDRALSEEEILQNFNASKWRYKDDMYVDGSTTS